MQRAGTVTTASQWDKTRSTMQISNVGIFIQIDDESKICIVGVETLNKRRQTAIQQANKTYISTKANDADGLCNCILKFDIALDL